jgi:hypothetical protein
MMRPGLFVLQEPTRGINRSVNDMPRVGCQTDPLVNVVRQGQKDVTERTIVAPAVHQGTLLVVLN